MRTGPHDGGHGDARNPVPERKWRVRRPHRPRFPVTCLELDAKRALCSPSLEGSVHLESPPFRCSNGTSLHDLQDVAGVFRRKHRLAVFADGRH